MQTIEMINSELTAIEFEGYSIINAIEKEEELRFKLKCIYMVNGFIRAIIIQN